MEKELKSASVTIGTTSTTSPGTNANVVNTGTDTDVILNFSIPRGEKGEQGEKGENGTNGENGKDGANGAGVASGGNNGDVLVKNSDADFSTSWKAQTEIAPVRSVNGDTGNVIIQIPTSTLIEYSASGSGSLNYTSAESKLVHSYTVLESGIYIVSFCIDLLGSISNTVNISFGQTLRQTIMSSGSSCMTEIMALNANSTINFYITMQTSGTINYTNLIYDIYKLA